MMICFLVLVLFIPPPVSSVPLSKGAFQVNATIVQYDGTSGDSITLHSLETFSDSNINRAKINVYKVQQGSQTLFCYQHSKDIWLAVNDRKLCKPSARAQLRKTLLGDTQLATVVNKMIQATNGSHIIGTSELLLYLEKEKYHRFIRLQSEGESESAFGSRVNEYLLEEDDLKLIATYEELRLGARLFESLILPSRLKIILKSNSNLKLTIHFRHFRWLNDDPKLTLDLRSNEPPKFDFVWPIGVGCSNVVRSQSTKSKLNIDKSLTTSGLSFTGCYSTFKHRLGSHVGSCNKFEVISDSRTLLLRRDISISTQSHQLTLRAIYDFRTNRKYSCVNFKDSHNSTCTFGKITNNAQDPQGAFNKMNRFISDRAIYMGSTQIGAQRVLVYEEQLPDGPPLWLEAQSSLDLEGNTPLPVSLVHYFSDSDPVIPIRLLVLNSDQQKVAKLIEIHEFNRLRTSIRNPFNIASFCGVTSARRKQMSILLQTDEPLNVSEWRTFRSGALQEVKNPVKRLDAIETSLYNNLKLDPTIVEISYTSLLHKPQSRSIGLSFEFKLDMDEVKINQRLSYQFISSEAVLEMHLSIMRKLEHVSADDCVSLADYFHNRMKSQLNYNMTDISSFFLAYSYDLGECLILYRLEQESSSGLVASLIWFPKEGTKYLVYQAHYTQDGGNYSSSRLIKTDLINQAYDLILPRGILEPYKLKLKVKDLKITEHPEEQNLNRLSIAGVAWHLDGSSSDLVWLAPQQKRSNDSFKEESATCRSVCLTHELCKSYSYCWYPNSNNMECLLSQLDLTTNSFIEQVQSLKSSSNTLLNSIRNFTIHSVDDFNERQVSVKFEKSCTIVANRYLQQFKMTYNHREEALGVKQQTAVMVMDVESCAALCYKYNLQLMRQTPRELRKTFSKLKKDKINLDQVESVIGWRKNRVRRMCTYFYHQHEDKEFLPEGGKRDRCIPSVTSVLSQNQAQVGFHSNNNSFTNSLYRLDYLSLYEATSGFRLLSSSPVQDIRDLPEQIDMQTRLTNYRRIMTEHRQGYNNQVQLLVDDVEHCAQACTLQTYGPQPLCASFDFIRETYNGADRNYCLLNSHVYKHLKSLGRSLEQTEHLPKEAKSVGTQYWHYEPRDGLLLLAIQDDLFHNDQIIKYLDRTLSQIHRSALESKAFSCILALLTTTALMSGFLLASKLMELARKVQLDEQTGYSGAMRLVHRLSGVGMRGYLRSGEVLM